MGKIILNNIEYGTGTPNSSNVDTTNLVKKDSIVTVIDENVTDEQIPSAKAVHTAIQNVSVSVPVNAYTKDEVNALLDDKVNVDDLVDAYSKDEVNDLLDSKADSTDIIDAYTKTEVDGLLATKADSTALDDKVDKTAIVTSVSNVSTDEEIPSAKAVHTAIQNVSSGVSTEQLEQAIEEAKTDLEEEFHTAMGKKMDVVTSYLNNSSGNLLDTTIAPLVLCALSATNNAGLYKIMNETFAYVITNFYSSMTPTSNRFQLAVGYTKDKMAFRRYNDGWNAWIELTTTTKLQSEINSFLTNKLTDYPTLEYMKEVKTDLENEIANIPKVTKTSELTNDSGFITANDIPDVDLEPYALKTQIPTTLPASDVYDWAKASTKPTYTASEVGALASNGTAVNASKVSNALTFQIGGETKNSFNGSSAKTFNIPNASTSASGVMTSAMVTKLNGVATGATKNTVTNNLTSTSTTDALSAYQGKVLNEAIDNLKNTVVSGKTSVANAINGKLGTTLSNQTSFADMAYYINTIPSLGSVNDIPNKSEFIQINLPVTREVLGGNSLALNKTVTIDGGLIMFVCDDDRESLRITPISSAIKVYGRGDGNIETVNAGSSFSTDGYEWFIFNPNRTQLSCIRVGLYDFSDRNPAINISIP